MPTATLEAVDTVPKELNKNIISRSWKKAKAFHISRITFLLNVEKKNLYRADQEDDLIHE